MTTYRTRNFSYVRIDVRSVSAGNYPGIHAFTLLLGVLDNKDRAEVGHSDSGA